MKTLITAFILLVFTINLKSQITLLPSFGLQTSNTKLLGTILNISGSNQPVTGGNFNVKLLLTIKNAQGIYLGFSNIGVPIKVKYYFLNQPFAGSGSALTGNDIKRFELGYFLNLKTLFLNSILDNNTQSNKMKGLNIATQAYLALGYSKPTGYGGGSVGGGSTQLITSNFVSRNGSLILGSNFLVRHNNKKLFVLSISKNWNTPTAVNKGIFSYTNNNQTQSVTVVNYGSGWQFNLGFPIVLKNKKNHPKN